MIISFKIAIVIPIHNRIEISKRGITDIQNSIRYYHTYGQGTCKITIVVVDDGSTDGSSEWISLNYPEITVLKGNGNLWWSGAINKGAMYAVNELETNYVLLWNDDTLCSDDYFYELEKTLSNSSYKNSILVSKVFWLQEPDKLYNFGSYYDKKKGTKKLIGCNKLDCDEFNDIIKVDWSGGMGTLIPATILKDINYFDNKNFPQYHGDIDFFLRAQNCGYKAFAIPTLKVWNDRSTTGINHINSINSFSKSFIFESIKLQFKAKLFICKQAF